MFLDFFRDFDQAWENNSFPAVNIYKQAEGLVVQAEIAGVHPENIEISLDNRVLTIAGKREFSVGEKDQVLRREIASTSFERKIQLNESIAADKIAAQAKDGLLTITLPLAEEAKPRKIEVKTIK